MRSYPADVIVFDHDSFLHVRLGRGRKETQIVNAKSYRLEGAFSPSVVTPDLANESALADALRRLRADSGSWSKVSVLLPDSWFRINLVELPSLPERAAEAGEVVRWSLKRTLPIPPEELRVTYEVLSKTPTGVKLLVVSAMEKTLVTLERIFSDAGFEIVLIEPVGLNIWNAVTVRENNTSKDRLFMYVRDGEFTSAVFRGPQPLFIRSRNLSGDRTLQQEIRLSATYVRDTVGAAAFEQCYLVGNQLEREVEEAVAAEFSSPVRRLTLRDFVEQSPADIGFEAELTACTGVFTA
jgi:Tfp pilus assembly PilM family ATPase